MLKLLIQYNFIFYRSRNVYVFQHWVVYFFFFYKYDNRSYIWWFTFYLVISEVEYHFMCVG